MRFEEHDTIAAIATAAGPAGVAVVRISGADAWAVAARVVPGGDWARRAAGTFFHAPFADPRDGRRVDDGLVLLFRQPASFTGEDVVELQGHGGAAASRAVLQAALAAGARPAAPGEFTRRAFLNGKIDLTQAEAVMDLVRARSGRAAQVAQAQLDGALGRRVAACGDRLAALGAEVEARLDFDDGELPPRVQKREAGMLAEILTDVRALLATWRTGELLRQGALVAIGGCPNAGKSSLMNALLGKDRAIVSPTEGTTRDVIEDWLQLEGVPLRLVDTAGLRHSTCPLEQEGVLRAGRMLKEADLVLYLIDGARPLAEQHPRLFDHAFSVDEPRTVVVVNKSDIPQTVTPDDLRRTFRTFDPATAIPISAITGKGLDVLRKTLLDRLGLEQPLPDSSVVSSRHRQELLSALQALEAAQPLLADGEASLVLAAEQLRLALAALGRITGKEWSEELLDRIFSSFCLGK